MRERARPTPIDEETYSLPRLPKNWPSFATLDTENEIVQIDFLGLSTWARNALARAGQTNLVKLICLPEDHILAVRRIGDQKAEEIRFRLELLRLMLKEKQAETPENLMVIVFTKEGFSIVPGPLFKDIELPEPIEIPVEEVIFEEIVEGEVVPAVPAYQFELPEGEEDLTEIDCLARLGLLANMKIINPLKRAHIINISQLRQTVLEEISVRNFGVKGRGEVGKALEQLEQLVTRLQEETPDETPVFIKVPPISQPPPTKEVPVELRVSRHIEILTKIIEILDENPGDRDCFRAAAEHFGVSTKWVQQVIRIFNLGRSEKIVDKIGQEITEEPISINQLAKQLGTPSRKLIELLREGEISLGEETIDKFFRTPPFHPGSQIYFYFKLIFPSLIDINELRKNFEPPPPEEKPVEEVMSSLTLSSAERNKDTFPPLFNLAQKANPRISRLEVLAIFKDLTEAGFHVRMIERDRPLLKYYFAHESEAQVIIEAIQAMPEGKYGRPKIFILGSTPSLDKSTPITTFQFQKRGVFVGTLKMLREVIREIAEPTFHQRYYEALLRYIVEKRLTTVPIFCYHKPRGNFFKIRREDLQRFEDEISANAEEFVAFLEKLKESFP